MGNRDREVSQRDLVRSRSHIDEWPEVSRQREDVEWPVGGDEMPLIARAEQGGGWYRARALALGAEDPCVEIQQRAGQSVEVIGRLSDRDVEILRQALAPICLNCNTTDGHVVDVVAGERGEQLASVESGRRRHGMDFARLAARRPRRSSAATLFQLNASSRRSDIGRLRAARVASRDAIGSRVRCMGGGDAGGTVSPDDFMVRSAYRGSTPASPRGARGDFVRGFQYGCEFGLRSGTVC